jgi:hypothetical protein
MEEVYKIANIAELITPARFLTNSGATPHEWNEKMLNDEHLKLIQYFTDSNTVFPNTGILGGVAITYRNANKSFEPIKIFIRSNELRNIATKIEIQKDFESISTFIYGQNKSNIDSLATDYCDFTYSDKRFRNNAFEVIPAFIDSKPIDTSNYIGIYGLLKSKRMVKYINKKYVDMTHENISKYKIVIPGVNGCHPVEKGFTTPVLGTCVICGPNIGYTQTFLSVGKFDTKQEAVNCLKYINTKFVRAAIGILKTANGNGEDTWKYVPVQNFTNNSDIDWSKSLHEIDLQLYKKYNFSKEDIKFIEETILDKNDSDIIEL